MAQLVSPLLGGRANVLPHTGIVAFGTEFFLGQGPCTSPPGEGIPMRPVEVLELGQTLKTRRELEEHIRNVIAPQFTPASYSLLNHNCNHYANAISTFLLGNSGELPRRILRVADEALSGPQGGALRGIIQNLEQARRGGSGAGLNPFGHMSNTGASSPPGVGANGGLPVQGTLGIEAALAQLFNVAQPIATQMAQSLGEIGGNVRNRSASLSGGQQSQGPEAAVAQLLGAGQAAIPVAGQIAQTVGNALQTSIGQVGREVQRLGRSERGARGSNLQNLDVSVPQLQEMGFHDRAACVAALESSEGDFGRALSLLLEWQS